MTRADDEIVLGVDVGTSGVRVAAIGRDGAMIHLATAPMPLRAGGVTRDARDWRRALDDAMAATAAEIDLARIRALAVDGTSGTVLAVDDTGAPVGPASLYNDPCRQDLVERIARIGDPSSASQGPSSALGRAIELAQRYPHTHRILHQADWIAAQFSGRFDASDESNALKTGYDPIARTWPAWIEAAGMPRRMLPEVVPTGSVFGRATARPFGLAADMLVASGATDGCAAFLATGAEQPGDGATSLGTTLVLKLLCPAPIFAPRYGIYSHRIGDTWLAGGASNCGGRTLLKFFSPERMNDLAPQVRPERSTGLDYYPLPAPGERFPVSDPDLAPRVTPRPTDDAAFFQGLLEGIAAVEKLGYDRIAELGGPPLRAVRTIGGGARNPAWTQIRGRVLNVPMLAAVYTEAACGAAALARRALQATEERS